MTILETLATGARAHLDELLVGGPAEVAARRRGHRGVMSMVKTAAVAAIHDGAAVPSWVAAAGAWLDDLEDLQADTGLFSSGDNLASPPDSAFTITDIGLTLAVLRTGAVLDGVAERLEVVLRRSLPALVAGGVHTPNHRWEISGALCRAGALLGAPEALDRARVWLSEGVDADEDGIYSERSVNYAAHVSNPSLLVVADVLGRDDLVDLVHRNLHAQLDLTDPRGVVETVYSRRQDQKSSGMPLGAFLAQLARFAGECSRCRHASAVAAASGAVDPVEALAHALVDPRVRGGLVAADADAGDDEPAVDRWFDRVRLLRRRRGDDWVTVYGGSDVPAAGRVASGLACNPTFLALGLGGVGVRSVRLSRDFFGLGPFRASGVERSGDRLVLHEEVAAGYYQPLPERLRRADGAYALEFEGRFAASMAFSQREVDLLRLRTDVAVDLEPDGVLLTITTDGPATAHALELALPGGGVLDGVVDVGDGRFHLVEGVARFTRGGATLEIGPGAGAGEYLPAEYRPGEAYEFLGGTDAVGGDRLYVTWSSPGTTTVRIARA